MSEPILESIVSGLQRRKGDWRHISEETDIPYSSLAKIAQGHNRNPTIETVQRLVDWLKANAKRPKRPEVP